MKKILLLISIAVIFGCGGDTRSFTNIVQTQTAENMIGNATATAVAEVTECTAEQGIVYDTLSESEKAKWVTECESSFTAAAQASSTIWTSQLGTLPSYFSLLNLLYS